MSLHYLRDAYDEISAGPVAYIPLVYRVTATPSRREIERERAILAGLTRDKYLAKRAKSRARKRQIASLIEGRS